MKRKWIGPAILGLLAALAVPGRAAAQDELPQRTAQFVQWALSVPKAVNPVVDTTGQFCMVGQHGRVWFLAGTFSGGTVTRDCTVPEGATLLFPIINGFAFNTPGCGQDQDLNTVAAMKQFYFDFVTGFINQAHSISATLNGRKLKITRVESVPFDVAIPPSDVFDPDACGQGASLTPGIYSPAINDGYWVVLAHLKPTTSPYTLHFHAESGSTVQEITYNLTVAPTFFK